MAGRDGILFCVRLFTQSIVHVEVECAIAGIVNPVFLLEAFTNGFRGEFHRIDVILGHIPVGVADMLVLHHLVPLAAGQCLIIVAEFLVTGHELLDEHRVTSCGCVIDERHTGTGHHRVVDQLVISILRVGRNLCSQTFRA